MSDTPRTDTESFAADDACYDVVQADFARDLEREIVTLRAEVEALKVDAERLDYAQKCKATLYRGMESRHWVFVDERNPNSRCGILGDSLRAAIDAARKESA